MIMLKESGRHGMKIPLEARRFIIWDPHDGHPQFGDDGVCTSAGVIGVCDHENCYLKTYAEYPADAPPLEELGINEQIENVHYRLSGQHGVYIIMRVA